MFGILTVLNRLRRDGSTPQFSMFICGGCLRLAGYLSFLGQLWIWMEPVCCLQDYYKHSDTQSYLQLDLTSLYLSDTMIFLKTTLSPLAPKISTFGPSCRSNSCRTYLVRVWVSHWLWRQQNGCCQQCDYIKLKCLINNKLSRPKTHLILCRTWMYL